MRKATLARASKPPGGRLIFVDTSAWVGYFVSKDQHHTAAAAGMRQLMAARRRLVTSDFIVDEVITRIRYQGSHEGAVLAGTALRTSAMLNLVEVGAALRDRAWDLFQRFDDQKLSFTDCTSAAIMNAWKIDEVFTFDDDFERIGFTRFP